MAGPLLTMQSETFLDQPRWTMKHVLKPIGIAIAFLVGVAFISSIARASDPLPSWNDGKAKQAIITFVEKVTSEGSPDFVPVPERIATFDNFTSLGRFSIDPTRIMRAYRIVAIIPTHGLIQLL
jgi:hypothetical protein